ncbi:hypothetical protein [Floridanema evergladense]|uniref:Uncharacterized protein n=1 Tax=Floridaenema evergladense BLCC-F167 TaxID=3153639 RepID=A0ABV4WCX7_9CYAN
MLEINELDAKNLQPYADSGIEQEHQKQKYPALQLNQYKGLQPNTPLFWCFSEQSLALIPEELREPFTFEKGEAYFKDDSDEATVIWLIKANIRFIPLNIPKVFKHNKFTNKYSKLSGFVPGDRTEAKLFLVPLIDGKLLVVTEKKPLILTLNLKSFKTEEIIGKSDTDDGTLKKLSSELLKYKIGENGKSNVHFVNVGITPSTKVYKNKDGESNRSVTYKLESAKLNSPEIMAVISQIFTKELVEDILDPYGLEKLQQTGIVPEQETRGIIKAEIKDFAAQLGWNISRIKQEIKEMFGADKSDDLSFDQLMGFRIHLENLVSLPSQEEEDIPLF